MLDKLTELLYCKNSVSVDNGLQVAKTVFQILVLAQKQLSTDVLQNRWSEYFSNIYRKTPALESVLNKIY